MAEVNKKLKAFVRLDANQRVIPSTLVMRKKKPSIGRWLEITADTCCTTTTIV